MALLPGLASADEVDRKAFSVLRPVVVKVFEWNPLTRMEDAHGTGFWYCPGPGCTAVIVTAKHCVEGLAAGNITRVSGAGDVVVPVRQLIKANDSDIAIIYAGDIKDKVTPQFAQTCVPIGESLWAAGYPLSEGLTFTKGIVTNYQPCLTGQSLGQFMTTSTNLFFGNSGCPLLDEDEHYAAMFVALNIKASHFRYTLPAPDVARVVHLLMQRIDRHKG